MKKETWKTVIQILISILTAIGTLRYRSCRYRFHPLGVSADLQSAVKKCPNLLWLCGFAIRSNQRDA